MKRSEELVWFQFEVDEGVVGPSASWRTRFYGDARSKATVQVIMNAESLSQRGSVDRETQVS